MGCFGCFGRRRKNRRRQSRRESFQPRLNRISDGSTKDVGLNLKAPLVEEVPKLLNLKVPSVVEVSSFEQVPEISVIPITDNKAEENHSPSPSPSPARKRVTFDSNVKTYEHIVVDESVELFEEKKEEVKSSKSREGWCSFEGSDVTSNSSGSYPSNHRYQNCRESDDEEEDVIDCDESDLEDIDDDDDDDGVLLHEDYYDSDNYEDKLENWDKEVYTEEIADNVMDIEKTNNASARDRSGYVNAVLNPIENLSQWKAVKSKGRTTTTTTTTTTTQTQSRKENTINASSFSLEPKSTDEIKKERFQEVANLKKNYVKEDSTSEISNETYLMDMANLLIINLF